MAASLGYGARCAQWEVEGLRNLNLPPRPLLPELPLLSLFSPKHNFQEPSVFGTMSSLHKYWRLYFVALSQIDSQSSAMSPSTMSNIEGSLVLLGLVPYYSRRARVKLPPKQMIYQAYTAKKQQTCMTTVSETL